MAWKSQQKMCDIHHEKEMDCGGKKRSKEGNTRENQAPNDYGKGSREGGKKAWRVKEGRGTYFKIPGAS